jgi:D-amino-acid dehydrogenase
MDAGLRIAGTVEIAGLDKPKSPRRIAYLTQRAQDMFGVLGVPDEEWLGFRPTLPDALPVIGRSTVSDRILFAFGHQHVGLTLGGITGRIITDLLLDRTPSIDISPFDPRRYGAPRSRTF